MGRHTAKSTPGIGGGKGLGGSTLGASPGPDRTGRWGSRGAPGGIGWRADTGAACCGARCDQGALVGPLAGAGDRTDVAAGQACDAGGGRDGGDEDGGP